MTAENIAIIGAGPAGATLARQLAEASYPVTLFDHRVPWEKPCGGMLGHTTRSLVDELEEYPYPVATCTGIRCFSPAGRSRVITPEEPIAVVSRRELGRFMLDEATAAGARFDSRRVLDVVHTGSQWRLTTESGEEEFTLLVGADGVRSLVRRHCLAPLPVNQLALICGCLGRGARLVEYIFAFPEFEGFLYLIPRVGSVAAGIGARCGTRSASELFSRLHRFIAERDGEFEEQQRFTALLPMISDPAFFDIPCQGENWMLIGDAAGHVDPLLGEGITWAVASAHCAAEAIVSGEICTYDHLWQERYGGRLREGAAFRGHLAELAADGDSRIHGLMTYERI